MSKNESRSLQTNEISHKLKVGFYEAVECTHEEIKECQQLLANQQDLPDQIIEYDSTFCHAKPKFPESYSFSDFLLFEQVKQLKGIRWGMLILALLFFFSLFRF